MLLVHAVEPNVVLACLNDAMEREGNIVQKKLIIRSQLNKIDQNLLDIILETFQL